SNWPGSCGNAAPACRSCLPAALPKRWTRRRANSEFRCCASPIRWRICATPCRGSLTGPAEGRRAGPGLRHHGLMQVSTPRPTRLGLARMAWPIILANASVPLLGLVDTAVIGHYGSTAALGGLALGALLFNFIYWSFGFLRMATTGFVAQADGAGDEAEVRATLARALLLGVGLGIVVMLLQWPLATAYFALMDASVAVENAGTEYFQARIWGAPAALALYAFSGALI